MFMQTLIAISGFILSTIAYGIDETQKQYVPIVLIHGAVSTDYDMKPTEQYIRKYMGNNVYIKNIQPPASALPSTQVVANLIPNAPLVASGLSHAQPIIDVLSATTNIYLIIEHTRKEIENDPNLKNGFNIVAHSQGGLVARYYIERYNNPPVFTYISWGSPQQGVFGFPGTLDEHFKWLDRLEGKMYHVLYSKIFQKLVSFAAYWHDTIHYDTYIRKSCFLPYINNEINHRYASLFKSNICKLKNMVLVASTNETIVEPTISCHFGFYKKGSSSETENLFDSKIYKKDTLGLKTLYEQGRLHFRFAHCTHSYFQEDESNFVENTLPYLQADPNDVPLAQVEDKISEPMITA